ncbi:MAG: hypothetical protein IJN84_01390, partial [Clostridia bacterium]|nr:hypothetical protein [Clostridia bacterium]
KKFKMSAIKIHENIGIIITALLYQHLISAENCESALLAGVNTCRSESIIAEVGQLTISRFNYEKISMQRNV